VALLGLVLFWLLSGGSLRFDSEQDAATDEVDKEGGGSLQAKKVLGGDVQALLADRGASISGRVLDPSGKPIAGATVCANSWSEELSTVQIRLPACTKTGPAGGYRLEGLFRVRYGVGASAPHHIPDGYDPPGNRDYVELGKNPEATEIDITLKPGGVEVRGVVRDVSGGEIDGAWVSAGEGWRWGMGGGGVGTRSNAKGEFSLWVKKGSLRVGATAEGYAPGSENGAAPRHYFEILLTPESVLVGKVVAKATGKPVEGAKVYARGSWDDRWGGNTAFSDADGRFRIDRLEPGVYKPMAEVDGGFGMAQSSVHLGLAQTSDEVLIEVHRAATVTGRVVLSGAKEGEGCDRGSVNLNDKAAGLMRWTETREGGEVEIKAVLPGKYEVDPGCEGAVAKKDYPLLEVGTEDIHGLEWEVDPGLSIRGIVVGPTGDPVDNVFVGARMKGGDPRGQRTSAWSATEDDGTFEIKGLLPGTYELTVHTLEQDHVEPIEPTSVTLEAGQNLEGVRIELDASGSIAGRVEDEQAEPIANVQVGARALERGWGGGASTADDGTFEIKAVRPGRYRVSASQGWRQQLREPGKGDDEVQGEVVHVTAGDTTEVTLVLERKDGVIRGQVVDEDGGPVPDAFLAAERESESAAASADRARQIVRWGWDRKPVLSDQDGRFEIGELAPGKYTVNANRKGGGEGFVEHVEVGSDVTVRIEPTAKLGGTVKVKGGTGLDRFTVMVHERKKAVYRRDQCFKTGGKWSVDGLPAGTYEISAEAPEGTGEKKGIKLAENEERTDIVIELAGKGTIRGSVVDLDTGEPIPGRRVNVSALGGAGGYSFRGDEGGKEVTDEQGRYEVEHVPAGKIRIMVMPQSFTMDDEYDWVWGAVAEAKAGEVTEIPPIKLVKRRIESRGRGGDLGFKIKEGDAEKEWHETPLEVAFIRPGGPAAKTDLKIGDIITAVDGHDVSGENHYLYGGLTSVPEGTTLSFTLERGATIRITAAKPL